MVEKFEFNPLSKGVIAKSETLKNNIDSLEEKWNSLKDKFSDQSEKTNQMIQQIDALFNDSKNLISLMPEEEEKTIEEIKDKIIAFENGNYEKIMGSREYIGADKDTVVVREGIGDELLGMENLLQMIDKMSEEKLSDMIRELEGKVENGIELTTREELLIDEAEAKLREKNSIKRDPWGHVKMQKPNRPDFGNDKAA